MRYNLLEDIEEGEEEHDHTPLFKFILYNDNKLVDDYQGMHKSGRVNMIIKESNIFII